MVNICIDASPLGTGNKIRGIGTYVEALIGGLEQSAVADLSLQYLLLAESDQAGLPNVLSAASARVQRVVTAAPGEVAKRSGSKLHLAMLHALRQSNTALYHAMVAEDIVRIPHALTVATIYDLIPLRFPIFGRILKHPDEYITYLRQLQRYKRIDHLIAISQATKDDAVEFLDIPAERISVVPLAISPERGHVPAPLEFQAAQTELGLQQPYFLGVAASDPHKNLARLFEAFAVMRQRHPQGKQFHCYITGTWLGRTGRQVTDKIAQLGLQEQVHHLTGVPTALMASLYHGATALVFPSLIEGFGLPILEAMSCGTPVITSNRSSMPEVGGDAVVYVNPEDVDALTVSMLAIATDPSLRSKLITRGLQQAQRFSWDRMVAETVAVYRKLLERI